MEDKIVVYKTFENPMEANIVKARLQDAGFECFLTGENAALVYPVFDTSISGIQLHVFEGEVEAINRFLTEDDALEGL
jgi:Putative prokaryotic signal transducing protein